MDRKDIFSALFAVSVWASMATVAKLVLSGIPNFQALTLGSLVAFLFLLCLNAFTGKLPLLRSYTAKDYLIMAALGFVGQFLYSALYYYGLTKLSSQEACILNYLWPMTLLMFSIIILKEPMTARKLIAMLCSFAGIVILSVGNSTAGTERIAGMAACVIAAVCGGFYTALNKKYNYDQNITMMIIWLTTAVCSFIPQLVLHENVPVRGTQWLGLLWLGAGVNGFSNLVWLLAVNRAKNTARIANLAYLTPFLSVLISAIVLRERLTLNAFLALVFIIGGILLQNLGEKQNT